MVCNTGAASRDAGAGSLSVASPDLGTTYFGDVKIRVVSIGRELHRLRENCTEVAKVIGLNSLRISQGHFAPSSIADVSRKKRPAEQIVLAGEASDRYDLSF